MLEQSTPVLVYIDLMILGRKHPFIRLKPITIIKAHGGKPYVFEFWDNKNEFLTWNYLASKEY